MKVNENADSQLVLVTWSLIFEECTQEYKTHNRAFDASLANVKNSSDIIRTGRRYKENRDNVDSQLS